MTRIRFENAPSTNTPINADNLNKLNNVIISSTEPTTGEEVWLQTGDTKKIHIQNANGGYEEFLNTNYELVEEDNWVIKKYEDGTLEGTLKKTETNSTTCKNGFGNFYRSDVIHMPLPPIVSETHHASIEATFTGHFSFDSSWLGNDYLEYVLISNDYIGNPEIYRLSAFIKGRWK